MFSLLNLNVGFKMKKFIVGSALGTTAIATLFACSHRTIEFERPSEDASAPSGFTSADSEPGDAQATLISYCPSTKCTNNTATCPTSRFPCDVDLMNDAKNCGACGVDCGGRPCVSGTCVLTCPEVEADCNGSVEDGCETPLRTNNDCSVCGDVCADPAKPCVEYPSDNFRCGCPDDMTYCGGRCVSLSSDDNNCSVCGQACDPTAGGQASKPNMYYGCGQSVCGKLKCSSGFDNCNGDLEDGCETSTQTAENCGSCGVACEPGQVCGQLGVQGVACLCPSGTTLCGSECVDLLIDPRNCGGCGINCVGATGNAQGSGHGIGTCLAGACIFECAHGWAECNGDPTDNCETKVASDPTNCGGCGIHCAKDQPCIGGQCAVEPCPDAGVSPQ